jgi:hypothetical protein
MKIKIRPYLKFLLIENLIYIVIAFILVIGFLFVPKFMLDQYNADREKVRLLDDELNQMRSKRNALIFLSSSKYQNLDDYYNLVTSLIPESENYFSIIYTLDSLSEITGFNIVSYTINVKKSTNNKLSLIVSGVGNQNDFLNFLTQYNIAGGRLITAEKIGLGKENITGISLTLNFYNKKSSLYQSKKEDYQKVLSKLDKIKNKITFNIKSGEEKVASSEYPIKANPF